MISFNMQDKCITTDSDGNDDRMTDSNTLTTLGLNGGWISLLASRSQSMRLKKACSLMSLSPSGPQPRRFDGCLVMSWGQAVGDGEKMWIEIVWFWRKTTVKEAVSPCAHWGHQGNVTSILRCAGVKPMTLVHISVNCPFMTSYSFANGHSFLWQGLWVRDVVLHDGLEELVLVFSIKRRLKRQNAESDSVTKNIE